MSGAPQKKSGREGARRLELTPVITVLAVVGIFFGAQLAGLSLVGLLAGLMGDWQGRLGDNTAMLFAAHLLIVSIGTWAIWLILRWAKETWQFIGLKLPRPVDGLYALAGYGYYLPLHMAASLLIGLLFTGVDFQQKQQIGFDIGAGGSELLLIFLTLVVVVPLYEELLTRGLLYSGLRKRLGFWAAAVITSLLFAVAHLQWGSGAPLLWSAAIDTFILSMVLVTLREKTGSLWPAVGLHAIKNGVAFVLLFVLKIG